jgi:hypothetical protein
MTQVLRHLVIQVSPKFYDPFGPLMIHLGLSPVCIRFIVFPRYHRVPGREFVHTGGAVPKVLSGNVDGHFDVKFEVDHFKRGCVPVA